MWSWLVSRYEPKICTARGACCLNHAFSRGIGKDHQEIEVCDELFRQSFVGRFHSHLYLDFTSCGGRRAGRKQGVLNTPALRLHDWPTTNFIWRIGEESGVSWTIRSKPVVLQQSRKYMLEEIPGTRSSQGGLLSNFTRSTRFDLPTDVKRGTNL